MTAHIHLGLVFHQHQPVGNYDFVFEELFAKSYEPLVAGLERHPGVKAGLHYSGPLLDWLGAAKPQYLARVRALVDRGQVEVLGGGYYEPVLAAVSEADRIGQMVKMRTAIEALFGTAPSGMWLPERVWEPALPTSINDAGYAWTIIDDVHFEGAGLRPEELQGWYLTEAEGKTIGVFGSSTRLRYLVPWGTVDACVDFLRAAGDRAPGSVVVMGDDGEKFGGWPTTFKHCWEDGWVDAFFARLEQESHWIETVKLSEWQASHRPTALAYLPATSYMEMGEWSLPPAEQHELERARAILREAGREDLGRFLRGGHWRNFLVRYPEVNLLHKRLLLLSQDAHRAQNKEALEHVWNAQCNCPFWHGVFGGVYLEHIRHANFGHLAAADAALYPGAQPPDVRDWDFDGSDEVCLRSASHTIVVSPAAGGAIQHWDLRRQGWHATHAIPRRPEAYHQRLAEASDDEVRSIHGSVRVKDVEALASVGEYDRGMRLAAQETLMEATAGPDDYRVARLAAPTRADSWTAEGGCVELSLTDGVSTLRKRLSVSETLKMSCTVPGGRRLFSEWNLSLPDWPDGSAPRFAHSEGELRIETPRFVLTAGHNASACWHHRLHSVSNTEDGVELSPQGWCIVLQADGGHLGGELAVEWSVGS